MARFGAGGLGLALAGRGLAASAQVATPGAGDPAASAALIQRYFAEFWNQGNEAIADQLVAPDAKFYTNAAPHGTPPSVGPASRKQSRAELAAAFPDLHLKILEQVAAGDTVVTYWLFTGTFTHPYRGLAPTGKVVGSQARFGAGGLGLALAGRGLAASAQVATPGAGDPAASAALIQRYFAEFWNQGNEAIADQLVAPDAKFYTNAAPHGTPPSVGPASRKQSRAELAAAFPDLHLKILEQVAAGDTVVTYWLFTGTFTHPYRGLAPTGKVVGSQGIQIDRIAGGQLAEQHELEDNLAFLIQIGAERPPTFGGAATPAATPGS